MAVGESSEGGGEGYESMGEVVSLPSLSRVEAYGRAFLAMFPFSGRGGTCRIPCLYTEDKAHYTEKQGDLRWSDTETEEQTA